MWSDANPLGSNVYYQMDETLFLIRIELYAVRYVVTCFDILLSVCVSTCVWSVHTSFVYNVSAVGLKHYLC